MQDFLPSYQLHRYLNRHLDEIINDHKLDAPPDYSEVANKAGERPIMSFEVREELQDGRASLVSDQQNSVWRKIDKLRYMDQSSVYIDIQLDDFTNVHYAPVTSGDIVKGTVKVHNIGPHPIPFDNIFVSFEGYFWALKSSSKMLIHNFLDMIDFEASCLCEDPDAGLPPDRVLRRNSIYMVRFKFQIPETSKSGLPLPPNMGDLHLRHKIHSQIQDSLFMRENCFGGDYSCDSFSISYSVNARLLELSETKDELVIRRHSRHMVSFTPKLQADDALRLLDPVDELRLLVNSLEDEIRTLQIKSEPSSGAKAEERPTYPFRVSQEREVFRLQLKSKPDMFIDKCLDYSLSSGDLQTKRSITISFEEEMKISSIDLYAVNYYSHHKLPVHISSEWFINHVPFETVIRPKFKELETSLETCGNEDSLELVKSVSRLKFAARKMPKVIQYKKKGPASYEIILTKPKKDIVIPSFDFMFCGRFYFLRFYLKLPRDVLYQGESKLAFDVPVSIH
ncbi:hypothetical protein KL937_003416 [Ogataea polymorpha]|uniref:uncharacterized protein n=1 Tax=Ogataea polymorpha TaxID=460523 RepID=UPI0007F366F6|nr:uncharacterized protein OGAPODRAFT_17365 [Ogataea polymorpha]KAG7879003.1 hypothetical protein KL937_003416 [Ogataea polymorpha]KAG7934263.1 hypothetical protein KL904_003597 [Ogataea polymorpha]OBA13574.1 hypothetical protein OGAPODRAFT_17365 [Ogataea polymorpha]